MATIATTVHSPYAGVRAWERILDWLTTVDHKKLGIMYIITAGMVGIVGAGLSGLIRTELAETGTIVSATVYNQAFTMHGSFMLLGFIIPVSIGFMNYILPLQIGAVDMAFPRVNALSFWMFLFAAILLLVSFVFPQGSAAAGWTVYPPISSNTAGNIAQPAGVGMDFWLVRRDYLGGVVDYRRGQLHGDDLSYASAGHDDVPHADVRVDVVGDVVLDSAVDAGAGGGIGDVVRGPEWWRRSVL